MSLSLDARQRAMLLEMGVRVWHAPGLAATGVPRSSAPRVQPASDVSARHIAPIEAAPALIPAVSPVASRSRPPAVPVLAPVNAALATAGGWRLLPMRLLYPDANPALAPAALGAGWLIVTQVVNAGEPWAEGAEKLLAAMLRAVQLHLHPRVAMCALQSISTEMPGPSDTANTTSIATADIAAQVAAFAPSVVLVMGRGPVRAALGLTDPLAKLRERDLRIAGAPVVATYDAPFLLRSPHCKRAAWADLCRARDLAGTPSA